LFLSDGDIAEALDKGRIRVSPPVDPTDIRPAGIRLHLSDALLVPGRQAKALDLDGESDPAYEVSQIGPAGFELRKGAFVLGASVEHISADADLICLIDGRSTLARVGLLVHCAAMTFDHIQTNARSVTFELANIGPFNIKLRAGAPVGLLLFAQLSDAVRQPPHGQYEGQSKPTAPTIAHTRKRS
jgi:dCTP deaminase